jgi:hypothetical protein
MWRRRRRRKSSRKKWKSMEHVKDEKEKDKLKWRRKKEIRKISKYIVV